MYLEKGREKYEQKMCEMRAAASGEGVFLSSLYGGSDRKTGGKSAGTLETGTLRLSTSFFNTPDQADRLVWSVSRVLRENVEL